MSIFWKYVLVFFISMVPLIELRGAVPIGLAIGMDKPWLLLLVSAIGNIIPVPFIYIFGQKILVWGKEKKGVIGRFSRWCLAKGEAGGEQLKAKSRNGLYIALMLFVGVPLPGTGAWTGTLAASFLGMKFRKSVIYVVLGILMAGLIMLAASYGLLGVLGVL